MSRKIRSAKSYIQLFILLFSFVSFTFDSSKININADSVMEASDAEIISINCEELGQWDNNVFFADNFFILDNSTHSSGVIIEYHTLYYINISNFDSITLIKSITFNFTINSLQIRDLMGFVVVSYNLIIIDFSDIFEPEYFIAYSFPDKHSVTIQSVDDLLYCNVFKYIQYSGYTNSTFHILNISNIFSPNLLSLYNASYYVSSFAIDNDILYLYVDSNTIDFVNCTNPSAPQFINSLDLLYTLESWHVYNSHIYILDCLHLTTYSDNLSIIIYDATNISDITHISTYSKETRISFDPTFWIYDISISFLTNERFILIHDEFYVFDNSNPGDIKEKSSFVTNNKNIEIIRSISLYNSSLLICYGNSLEMIDVSNYKYPKLITSFNYGGDSWDIVVKEHYAFIADGYEGLEIIDCLNLSTPILLGRFANGGYYYKVAVFYETAFMLKFVGNSQHYLEILDISNLTNPTLISTKNLGSIWSFLSVDMQIENERLYIFHESRNYIHPLYIGFSFDIYDISDANDIHIIGSYNRMNLPYFSSSNNIHAVVDGYTVYLINVNSDIEELGVYDPENIQYRGNVSIDDSWKITDIDYQDDCLYLATENLGLLIFPTDYNFDLDHMIQYDIPLLEDPYNGMWTLHIDGPFLYVGEFNAGLSIYLITNKTNIVKLGEYDDGGFITAIDVSNNVIFVSDIFDNLEIIHQSGLDYTWPPSEETPPYPAETPPYFLIAVFVIPVVFWVAVVLILKKQNRL